MEPIIANLAKLLCKKRTKKVDESIITLTTMLLWAVEMGTIVATHLTYDILNVLGIDELEIFYGGHRDTPMEVEAIITILKHLKEERRGEGLVRIYRCFLGTVSERCIDRWHSSFAQRDKLLLTHRFFALEKLTARPYFVTLKRAK